MKEWNLLKQDISKFNELSKNNNNWRHRFLNVKNNFDKISISELKEISENDKDIRVQNEAKDKLNILQNYNIRYDFNNVVTVKLIIPSRCNSKCSFCYNKHYIICNTEELFISNLDSSIEKILSSISPYFPISLDITGGEPTLDIGLFRIVLKKLRLHPLINKFCRITINTNGFNLDKLLPEIEGLIDYVNISTHYYDEKKRWQVFKTYKPTDNFYRYLVLKLLEIGVDTSTVCVIHEDINNFELFNKKYIEWCKEIGFVSLRYRNDSFQSDSRFQEYMNSVINSEEYHLIQTEKTNDSTWCRLSDNDGFFIFFLSGVLDTSKVSKGIEYVIHSDGILYTDYEKETLFRDYNFPVNFIFDLI